MKIGQLTRQLMQEEYKRKLENINYLFFTGFKNMKSDNMRLIRERLRSKSSNILVVKNSILQRVFEELNMNRLIEHIDGELAVVYGEDDAIAITKQLKELSKDFEGFVVKLGLVEDRIIDSEGIQRLASIPSKEVLISQILSLIKSPLSKMVFVLKGNINSIVNILRQIKEKKS